MISTRKAIFLCLCMLCLAGSLSAQFTLLPSGDFENWDNQGNYEEPSGNFWVTLNPLRSLAGPVTVTKSTDAWNGTYSARLETKSYGTLDVPGLLVSGIFDLQAAPDFLLPGLPYTQAPSRFMGHYKYFPVNGDSAAIGVVFTQYQNGARDTIGEAGIIISDSVPVWTAFDIAIQWFVSNPQPDSIIVALVSSADGANFNGQVGSTLYVDDIGMDLTTLIVCPFPEAQSLAYPNPADQKLYFQDHGSQGESLVEVLDTRGRKISQSSGLQSIDTHDWAEGLYFVRFLRPGQTPFTQKVIIRHED